MKKLILETKDLKPSNPTLSVLGVFNPAITKYNDEIIMLARVSEAANQTDKDNYLVPSIKENGDLQIIKLPRNDNNFDFSDLRVIKNHQRNYLSSISHFRVGRSKDGYKFSFDDTIIFPEGMYEEYGIEDPRITKIDDTYYITYTGVSSHGINVRLMTTKDFIKFEKLGNIFHPDNKDCVIFPEKINGKFHSLHRPSKSEFGKLDIWLAESDNLLHWGNHRILYDARVDFCESVRVGAGTVPILTDRGWLEIYHSADKNNNYKLVAMLMDKERPYKILMKSKKALLYPTESYEKEGFIKNVVFTCGHLMDDHKIMIYYGACDERVAVCEMNLDQIWENMEAIENV